MTNLATIHHRLIQIEFADQSTLSMDLVQEVNITGPDQLYMVSTPSGSSSPKDSIATDYHQLLQGLKYPGASSQYHHVNVRLKFLPQEEGAA